MVVVWWMAYSSFCRKMDLREYAGSVSEKKHVCERHNAGKGSGGVEGGT